jgi:hypothetical protein
VSSEAARKRTRERVQTNQRRRMGRRGMRLVQMWVPDTRSPGFAAEMLRQSQAVAESPGEAEDQAFVDSISVFWDDE